MMHQNNDYTSPLPQIQSPPVDGGDEAPSGQFSNLQLVSNMNISNIYTQNQLPHQSLGPHEHGI